ncbi:MAG: M4 family metallopeptidase, partial [Pseudomonadota bacterium]
MRLDALSIANKALALGAASLAFFACDTNSEPVLPEAERETFDEAPGIVSVEELVPGATEMILDTRGVPAYLAGDLGSVSLLAEDYGSVELGMRPVVAAIAPAFGVTAEKLQLFDVKVDKLGHTHAVYQQYENDIEVVNGRLLVHVNQEGEVYAANGAVGGLTVSVASRPAIDASAALEELRRRSRYSVNAAFSKPRLVYVRGAHDEELHLSWEIMKAGAQDDGVPVRDMVYLDATNGEVVAIHPKVYTVANREVYSLNGLPKALPAAPARREGDAATADVTVNAVYDRLGEVYDCYGSLFGRRSYDDYDSPQKVMVHYEDTRLELNPKGTVEQSRAQLYWSDYPYLSTDATGALVKDANGNPTIQAVYDPQITMGDGDAVEQVQWGCVQFNGWNMAPMCVWSWNTWGCVPCELSRQWVGGMRNPGHALEVVAHEFTHGVTSSTAGLVYMEESGALNEAFSDSLAARCVARQTGAVNAGTWQLGGGWFTPHWAGDAMRYMNNPVLDRTWVNGQCRQQTDATSCLGAGVCLHSTDYYADRWACPAGTSLDVIRANDGGFVHLNSGIMNLAFYLLSQDPLDTMRRPVITMHPRAGAVLRTGGQIPWVGVPGIGIDRAAQIFYRALDLYLSATANFAAARAATVQAARDLYPAEPAVANAVGRAWQAVGVFAGAANPATIADLGFGVPVGGLRGVAGERRYYRVEVPAGASVLTVELRGGNGNADLFVRVDDDPNDQYELPNAGDGWRNPGKWDFEPAGGNGATTNEVVAVAINPPAPAKTFYNVLVYARSDYDNVTLEALASNCSVAGATCCPAVELCGNRIDDNCDGMVDSGLESCNGADDDCDGTVDEAGAAGCSFLYQDADRDGYGAGNAKCLCQPDRTYSTPVGLDCNDSQRTVNPGHPELCGDGLDNDCLSFTDENLLFHQRGLPCIVKNGRCKSSGNYECSADRRQLECKIVPGTEVCQNLRGDMN